MPPRVQIAFPGIRAAALDFIRGGGGGPTDEPETTALVAAMTVAPSAGRKTLINNLILSLKSAGVWTKLDFLHVIAAHDAQAGRINWRNPAQVATVGGTATFTVDRGYQGDGTTGYIDTGLLLSTLTNYKQDTAHIGGWCATEAGGTSNQAMVGTLTTNTKMQLAPKISNNVQSRLNNVTAGNTANTVSKGHSLITRVVSTGFDVYKDGASIGSVVQTSAAVAAENIVYLRNGANFNGNWQIAAGHGGLNLSSTEIANLFNALSTYMTALGV